MAHPQTEKGPDMTDRLEEHDEIIEVFVDFKKGLRTIKTATAEMVKLGFHEGVATALLRDMKKHDVTEIRNKSYEPEQLRNSINPRKRGCNQRPSAVDTDNK
jgi:hypothetical protein